MAINNETKNKIINDINNNIPLKQIIEIYKISKPTYFRIKKQINKTNNETLNNETENNIENDTETEINNTKLLSESENNFDYDIDEFKKELNESNNESKNESNNESKNISIISKLSKKSNKSIVKFKKKQNDINDKNNIIDIIKNTNIDNGDINDLKERRSTIIIIKQYINTFPKELISIYTPNKIIFEKKLFTLDINKLKTILEDIRCTISLSSNKQNFITLSSTILKGIEKIACYSGYDVENLEQELMKNPEFIYDLNILQCEIDVSKYINSKSSVFLKIVRKMYTLQQENKIKSQVNEIINNEDILEKVKNLK